MVASVINAMYLLEKDMLQEGFVVQFFKLEIATSIQVRSEDMEQRCIRDKPDAKEGDVELENIRSLIATKV